MNFMCSKGELLFWNKKMKVNTSARFVDTNTSLFGPKYHFVFEWRLVAEIERILGSAFTTNKNCTIARREQKEHVWRRNGTRTTPTLFSFYDGEEDK